MSNRKTLDEKILAAREEVKQKEARVKLLLQQQKRQANKDRNHRLCMRGGKVEKLLPELARLTEEQFETFVKKCLLSSYTKGVLADLAPPDPADGAVGGDDAAQSVGNAATQPTATAARTETPAPKPPAATHSPGANGNGKTAQAAKVAG